MVSAGPALGVRVFTTKQGGRPGPGNRGGVGVRGGGCVCGLQEPGHCYKWPPQPRETGTCSTEPWWPTLLSHPCWDSRGKGWMTLECRRGSREPLKTPEYKFPVHLPSSQIYK